MKEGNFISILKATTAEDSEIFAKTYPEIRTDIRGRETGSAVS